MADRLTDVDIDNRGEKEEEEEAHKIRTTYRITVMN
jgi:hypothetical protein